MRNNGHYIGIGLCFIVEPAGVAVGNTSSGLTQARLRLTPDGRLEIYSDRTDIGQGADTSHALVAASIIGINEESITVHPVSGALAGMGPVSSRGSVYPLSAVAKAARIMKSKLARLAGVFLEAAEQDVIMVAGDIYARNKPEVRLSFPDLAQKIYFRPGPRALPEEMLLEGDFLPDVTTTWFSPNTAKNKMSTYTTFCASADLATVEIDIETGQVKILQYSHAHDAGVQISQAMVDAQVHGGIAQGIGEALTEELVYSPDGQLLSDSYVDYVIPICPDAPEIEVYHLETPSPYTELGTKGMGEAPIISGKAVIISAVVDALRPLKIDIRQTPMTSENIRKLVLASIGANPI
jgi:carbon-monoxide dehydrogenase large subunit